MKKALKIGLAIFPLLVLSVTGYFLRPDIAQICPENELLYQPKSGAMAFLGSSRIRYGIKASELSLPAFDTVLNLGINGANLFHSYKLMTDLHAKGGYKMFVVEFMLPEPAVNSYFISMMDARDAKENRVEEELWHSSAEKYLDYEMGKAAWYVKAGNERWLHALSSGFRELMNWERNRDMTDYCRHFGEADGIGGGTTLKTHFLSDAMDEGLAEASGNEFLWVEKMRSFCEEEGIELVFILPLSSNDPRELPMLQNAYRRLPDNQRIDYRRGFLDSICKPENCYDEEHLNVKGAGMWTDYLQRALLLRVDWHK